MARCFSVERRARPRRPDPRLTLKEVALEQEHSDTLEPVTPGEVLAEELLAGFGLTQAALAQAPGISPNRITEIVSNRRRITADTALRLGLFFGTTPEFWQNLHAHYDMTMARRGLPPEVAEWIVAQRVA